MNKQTDTDEEYESTRTRTRVYLSSSNAQQLAERSRKLGVKRTFLIEMAVAEYLKTPVEGTPLPPAAPSPQPAASVKSVDLAELAALAQAGVSPELLSRLLASLLGTLLLFAFAAAPAKALDYDAVVVRSSYGANCTIAETSAADLARASCRANDMQLVDYVVRACQAEFGSYNVTLKGYCKR